MVKGLKSNPIYSYIIRTIIEQKDDGGNRELTIWICESISAPISTIYAEEITTYIQDS